MVAEEKRVARIGRLELTLKKERTKLAEVRKEEKAKKNASLGPAFEAIYKAATPKEKAKFTECLKSNLSEKALARALDYIAKMDEKKAPTTSRTKRILKKASETLKVAETAEVVPNMQEMPE